MLLNAHYEPVEFVLPRAKAGWAAVLTTGPPGRTPKLPGGERTLCGPVPCSSCTAASCLGAPGPGAGALGLWAGRPRAGNRRRRPWLAGSGEEPPSQARQRLPQALCLGQATAAVSAGGVEPSTALDGSIDMGSLGVPPHGLAPCPPRRSAVAALAALVLILAWAPDAGATAAHFGRAAGAGGQPSPGPPCRVQLDGNSLTPCSSHSSPLGTLTVCPGSAPAGSRVMLYAQGCPGASLVGAARLHRPRRGRAWPCPLSPTEAVGRRPPPS